MVRLSRFATLAVATAALVGASTLNFDTIDTSGGSVMLTNQFAEVLFGTVANGSASPSGGATCTRAAGCGFVASQNTSGGVIVPSAPNYAAVAGNAGTIVTLDFTGAAGPVTFVSFDLLGLNPNLGGFYDGATVTFLDAGNNILGTQTINPVGPTGTTINSQAFSFSSATNIHEIRLSKIVNANGDAMFGFDNLTFAAPEPSSLLLLGGGMLALALARRRAARS